VRPTDVVPGCELAEHGRPLPRPADDEPRHAPECVTITAQRSLSNVAPGYAVDMTDQNTSAAKPTEEWVTGDEPLTGPQASYLETLAREAGETVPENLTKAQASELIDRLQSATGRGADPDDGAK
jgi:hypothetical protein